MTGNFGPIIQGLPPEVSAAVIAAAVALLTSLLTLLVSPVIRHAFDRASVRHRLKVEYEYEQRKRLRNLIGHFRGQMLEAGEILNHRMFNLYANENEGWLDVQSDYSSAGYYFRSMVSRFLGFCCLFRRFQIRALYVDPQIAAKSDLDFVKYAKAFEWVSTDVALFEGVSYDNSQAKDHFFRDELRSICDECIIAGRPIGAGDIEKLLGSGKIDVVLRFFDGISSHEPRLRWDRMVAFHLLLMAFINEFGYDVQRSTFEQFGFVCSKFKHVRIRENLRAWLPRLGFERQREAVLLARVLAVTSPRLESTRVVHSDA